MLRKKLFFVLSVFVLFACVSSGFAVDYTNYNYGDVSKDVTDISFYKPAADTNTYDSGTIFNIKKAFGVKNVIFCIGDGTGISQLAVARIKATGLNGKLYIEKMPVTGLIRTHSADSTVTDSAAAGTALACGIKTNNGTIGMNPDGVTYQSILEAAKEEGMKTALVVTSTISHATPASFASHVKSRGSEADIASQMLANKVNVMFGGGKQSWLPKSAEGSKREDERNLIEEAKTQGYVFVNDSNELSKATGDYVLGLFQMDALTTFSPEPSLPQMTEAALRILAEKKKESFLKDKYKLNKKAFKRDKGFFMMIEGSQIDWACHGGNVDNCIKQALLFDQAVKIAIDFAIKDKNTLVIVAADHETGGLVINGGNEKGENIDVKWTSGGHSGTPVPVYAFGPGAGKFTGVMDNTEIPKKLADLMGITDFPTIKKND